MRNRRSSSSSLILNEWDAYQPPHFVLDWKLRNILQIFSGSSLIQSYINQNLHSLVERSTTRRLCLVHFMYSQSLTCMLHVVAYIPPPAGNECLAIKYAIAMKLVFSIKIHGPLWWGAAPSCSSSSASPLPLSRVGSRIIILRTTKKKKREFFLTASFQF